ERCGRRHSYQWHLSGRTNAVGTNLCLSLCSGNSSRRTRARQARVHLCRAAEVLLPNQAERGDTFAWPQHSGFDGKGRVQ
ncbi:unnamed protein product, partial [Symbiodinium microadriaticum]